MSRRGYGSSIYSGRRPRTKVYDCNYTAGEDYYRSALDGLDRKRLGLPPAPADSIPVSTAPAEIIQASPRERPRSIVSDLDAAIMPLTSSWGAEEDDILTRVRAARRSQQEIAEKSLDSVITQRSEQTDRRFAKKMLDSVGITGEEIIRTPRRVVPSVEDPVWPALAEGNDSSAASVRARATRARLADLEAEMEANAERSVARQRRAAALRQLLSEESSMKLTETVTTEKRVAAM